MTITEFLLDRIAEDERAARQATTVTAAEWVANGSLLMYIADSAARMAEAMASVEDYRMDDAWRHAERHDPARVLAECQAKRAIVEEHPAETKWMLYGVDGDETYCAAESDPDGTMAAGQPFPCPTIRHLAAVYATHPAYDPAWRP